MSASIGAYTENRDDISMLVLFGAVRTVSHRVEKLQKHDARSSFDTLSLDGSKSRYIIITSIVTYSLLFRYLSLMKIPEVIIRA